MLSLRSLASLRLCVNLNSAVMTENAIAKTIVDAAYRIHTALNPGLMESVYVASVFLSVLLERKY